MDKEQRGGVEGGTEKCRFDMVEIRGKSLFPWGEGLLSFFQGLQ
jgi:hypothetical protein